LEREGRLEIHNLFPTALGMFDIGRVLTEDETSFIKKQDRRPNMGNTTSVDVLILKNAELASIKSFIEKSISEYFEGVYAPKNETHLRITQSWCNYTEQGQFHHKHSHPNSFISGVFYIKANEDTDKIYFYKDGFQQLKTPTKEWNTYNSDSWWMPVYSGRLFIFPSHLTHMVESVESMDTRISLSFNTFPVGNFGNDFDLTGLSL
jgi:uncharacterized protein (TIGR02466 family)